MSPNVQKYANKKIKISFCLRYKISCFVRNVTVLGLRSQNRLKKLWHWGFQNMHNCAATSA